MNVRVANKEDLNALSDLTRKSRAHWGYDETSIDSFMVEFGLTAEYLSKETTIIVFEQDKMIGFYSFSADGGGEWELDNFFLHPDFIGKGKGKELWGLALETAIDYGVSEFIIWSNPYAESFYLKMGCKKIGERKSPLMPNCFPLLKYVIENQPVKSF